MNDKKAKALDSFLFKVELEGLSYTLENYADDLIAEDEDFAEKVREFTETSNAVKQVIRALFADAKDAGIYEEGTFDMINL